MSDEHKCCKAPILDLLRSTPIDGRVTHEEGEGVCLRYHMIPYGHHCHEAADEIERLRAELGDSIARIGAVEKKNLSLRAEVAEKEEYIRVMVQKAADNNLEGYRDMGRQLAERDKRIEELMGAIRCHRDRVMKTAPDTYGSTMEQGHADAALWRALDVEDDD